MTSCLYRVLANFTHHPRRSGVVRPVIFPCAMSGRYSRQISP
ncbi:hypothetical protein SAMN05216188_11933 [Lentzea xinjiangensis]|uniref:Uncharacterized protein n=1 Tax=Lentzea xinjiangensis TaxID=402600 RepID=A0A1H9TSE1_9PSEU|nr:hypothetical protein [Lentzea xinjiangensis]SER99891.1 hypothetical protein SAMN05216188_11933 [Lentzea xinjiangensis]